ncbi:hypothetical protein C8R44DRAFT_783236 [Mycena epipterygia]|nr:hypothetical protein C8R44DRAFT_783236 [Mycena epipterygia]
MGDPPAHYPYFLPTEIWLACWTLCSTRQLRRVSLVCQLFRSICLPLLLRQQRANLRTLSAGFHRRSPQHFVELARRMHRIAVRLDRLAEGPRVLSVRSWTFIAGPPVWNSSDVKFRLWDDIYLRAITTFSNTLGLYQHLCTLQIVGLTIDKSLRQALVSLPMLEDLTLVDSDIIARDGGLLRLKSYTGSSRVAEEILSSDRMHTLKILGNDETSPLLTGLSYGGKSIQLVNLSLHFVQDLDLFFRFLKQCPRLESMEIQSIIRPLPTHIHPDTIPLLRNLTAPLDVVRLLTPNRPVCALKMLEWPTFTHATEVILASLLDISRASIPLRSLVAMPTPSPTPNLFRSITSLFPELRDLSFTILEDVPRRRMHCHLKRRPRSTGDPPSLELCDEEAFDNLPPEDMSDDEDEDAPPAILVLVQDSIQPELPTSTKLYSVLNGICDGVVPLPPNLAVLCLQVQINIPRLSAEQEQQVVASLSRMCPRLREIQIGLHGDSPWVREDGGAVKQCIRVQQ